MKKTAALLSIVMVLVIMMLALAACGNKAPDEPLPEDPVSEDTENISQEALEPVSVPAVLVRETDNGWSITGEWAVDSVDEENGDNLKLIGGTGSEAYNTSFTLRDAWDIVATIEPSEGANDFGFALGTIDLTGIGQILLATDGASATLTVSYLAGGNFNELLVSEAFALDGPVTLTVSKLAEDRKLLVNVQGSGGELYSGIADEIPSTFMRLMSRAGLKGLGNVGFADVRVITYAAGGDAEIAIAAIDPGPHVENPDYEFENAIWNEVDGEGRIIIDSNAEGGAWYIAEEFEGDWTVRSRVQIGNWNGGESGCARFAFGRVDDEGEMDMYGMFTVLIDINNNLLFQNAQQLRDGNWSTKAGGTSWVPIHYPIFDMTVSYRAGDNVLNIQFTDLNGDEVFTITTREYDPGYLDDVKYFAFFVWQSQIQVTEMEYIHSFTEFSRPEEDTPTPAPGASVFNYTPYSDFGASDETDLWNLDGIFSFRSAASGDALGVDGVGKGEARALYLGEIAGNWAIESTMRFESARENFSGRIYLYDEDWGLKGIVSAMLNDEGEAWLEAQMLDGDWTNLIETEPVPIPTADIWLSIGKKTDNVLAVRALDEQGRQIFFGETEMANLGEVTRFAFVANETCMVFDNILIGPHGGDIVSMGASVADFVGGGESPVWTLGDDVFAGTGSSSGEALLFNSDLNTSALADLGDDAFSLSMDIMYDVAYAGRFMTRFFLQDSEGLAAIIDYESGLNQMFTVKGQKYENGEWADILGSSEWAPMVGRNAFFSISRVAGDNKLHVVARDFAGNTLFEGETEEFGGAININKVEIHASQVVTVLDNLVLER